MLSAFDNEVPLSLRYHWGFSLGRCTDGLVLILGRCYDGLVFHSGDVQMVWFWSSGEVCLEWFDFASSGHVCYRWFDFASSGEVCLKWFEFGSSGHVGWDGLISVPREMFCWDCLVLVTREAYDLIQKTCQMYEVAWFFFCNDCLIQLLGRSLSDLGLSGDVVSWWPSSGDVIKPCFSYPIPTWALQMKRARRDEHFLESGYQVTKGMVHGCWW